MGKNKVEKLTTEFVVVPRIESKWLPDAMVPTRTVCGYDVIELRCGEEVRRHEFTTRQEADHFANQEREFYWRYVVNHGQLGPQWFEALFFVALVTLAVLLVKCIL